MYKQSKTPEEYLNQRVVKTPNGCWLWTFGVDRDGYGQCQAARVARRAKVTRAHQLAYVAWVGTIPPNKVVCHHRDVPKCCNPKHLFAGTVQDNNEDKRRKGRARSGSCKTVDPLDVIALEGVVTCMQAGPVVGLSWSRVAQYWRLQELDEWL
jgi:hypothetical protein